MFAAAAAIMYPHHRVLLRISGRARIFRGRHRVWRSYRPSSEQFRSAGCRVVTRTVNLQKFHEESPRTSYWTWRSPILRISRISPSRQSAKCREIQMVIILWLMSTASMSANHPSAPQVFVRASDLTGHRPGSFRPKRVRQNVQTQLLNEHSRVVHERDSQLAALDAAKRYRLLDVRNETGRRFRPASQLPSKCIQEPRLRCIRIVKTPSVKVLWES
jgi:hypothetical protein